MIKDLVVKAVSKREPKYFAESYCKLKRNESILQRITACIWTST